MNKQLVYLILLAAVPSVVPTVEWSYCIPEDQRLARIHDVTIPGCGRPPCEFIVGNTYVLGLIATSYVHSNTANYNITLLDPLGMGVPVAYLASGNGCANLGNNGSCPFRAGEQYTYLLPLTVPRDMPTNITTFAQLVVRHDIGQIGICIRILVRGVSSG